MKFLDEFIFSHWSNTERNGSAMKTFSSRNISSLLCFRYRAHYFDDGFGNDERDAKTTEPTVRNLRTRSDLIWSSFSFSLFIFDAVRLTPKDLFFDFYFLPHLIVCVVFFGIENISRRKPTICSVAVAHNLMVWQLISVSATTSTQPTDTEMDGQKVNAIVQKLKWTSHS